MRKATKISKSFSLDPEVFSYIVETSDDRSVSSRLNELLERAILQERYSQLEREAEEFFATEPKAARKESRAFQKASLRSMARD